MCDALAELGEEGNEDYVVCNCMHSFIACLAFQVFDFFGVGIALVAYGALNYFQETSLYTTLPFVVLLFFAAALPLGVVGLLYQRPNLLVVYNTRLSIVVLWSLAWMTFSLLSKEGILGFAVSLFWFLAALCYFWGLFVTSKALNYVTTHYRGYDDVDPERVQFIEQMLRDMIDEIKQKELDIAAGLIPKDGLSGDVAPPVPKQEVSAKEVERNVKFDESNDRVAPVAKVTQ
ncbi:hypothetical protein RB195_019073 [Necator americanus]